MRSDNQNTYFVFDLFPKNRAVYEIKRKILVSCVTKATNTRSEYVILVNLVFIRPCIFVITEE